MFVSGWCRVTAVFKGWERVSMGMEGAEGLMTKQWSMKGAVELRVRGVFAVTPGKSVISPVGMRVSSQGWWREVPKVTVVEAVVGAVGLRLK